MNDITPTKQYLVGVQNACGEEYFHCNSPENARQTIEELLIDGNSKQDIVVFEAIPVDVNIEENHSYFIEFQDK